MSQPGATGGNDQDGYTQDMPSTEGQTDQQIEQQLDSANTMAWIEQGGLFNFFDPQPTTYGSAQGSGGGGSGYQFDPQHIESILTELRQHRRDCIDDVTEIEKVRKCQPPAPDADSSVMQANAVKKWGQRLLDDNQTMIKTLRQRIREFEQAKHRYMEQERITEEQWNKLAQGMQA